MKEDVKAIVQANLYEMEILAPPQASLAPVNWAGTVSQASLPDLAFNFEQQKELLVLQMQWGKEKQLYNS